MSPSTSTLQAAPPKIDFVFSYRGEPTLVECKSNNGRMTSMRYVLDTQKGTVRIRRLTLPLYALGFLEEAVQELVLPQVELGDLRV